MVDKEGYYWVHRPAGDWVIQEATKNPFDPGEFVWFSPGSEEQWPEPDGEVGTLIEPPEWVVYHDGAHRGPFTRAEAMVHAATLSPTAKVLKV
jgi:hypothetical protein